MRLAEAIRLGSTLLKPREGGSREDNGTGCALQAALLAVGRKDLIYLEDTCINWDEAFKLFPEIEKDLSVWEVFDKAVCYNEENPFEIAAQQAEKNWCKLQKATPIPSNGNGSSRSLPTPHVSSSESDAETVTTPG